MDGGSFGTEKLLGMESFETEKLLVDGIIWGRKTFGGLGIIWDRKKLLGMESFETEKLLVNGIIWGRKTFGDGTI